MRTVTYSETCSCGAKFSISGDSYRSAGEMAERWRVEHKHVEPTPRMSLGIKVPEDIQPKLHSGRKVLGVDDLEEDTSITHAGP